MRQLSLTVLLLGALAAAPSVAQAGPITYEFEFRPMIIGTSGYGTYVGAPPAFGFSVTLPDYLGLDGGDNVRTALPSPITIEAPPGSTQTLAYMGESANRWFAFGSTIESWWFTNMYTDDPLGGCGANYQSLSNDCLFVQFIDDDNDSIHLENLRWYFITQPTMKSGSFGGYGLWGTATLTVRHAPDPGSTLLLLGVGLVVLQAGRNRWR